MTSTRSPGYGPNASVDLHGPIAAPASVESAAVPGPAADGSPFVGGLSVVGSVPACRRTPGFDGDLRI